MFLLWILLILGGAWVLVRLLQDRGALSSFSVEPRETPLEVLKRRYAEGEISAEEYEERKGRLERNP